MKHRRRMGKKNSRRLFRRTAGRTHKRNLRATSARGGIRL